MRRRAACLLFIPLALLPAACGGAADEDASTAAPAAASSPATTPATTAEPATTEAPAPATTTSSSATTAAGAAASDLKIELWPAGREAGASVTLRLTCDPPGGDVPNAAAACTALAAQTDPFAPPPKDVACTEIYGGPEEAHVTGTYQGARVDATFDRTNGCAIARWSEIVASLSGQSG